MSDPLDLEWSLAERNYVYWYDKTKTRFSSQIGASTTAGLFTWMIFHEDFVGAVHGEEVDTVEAGKKQAQEWLYSFAKPISIDCWAVPMH
jgi:hypothetical protein